MYMLHCLYNFITLPDPVKIVNTTPTKAVYSLAINPHNDYHLVSHVDNQITIWDTRYFEKPVLTLSQARQVTKVLWCPTRHNLLGSLQKDSGVVTENFRITYGRRLFCLLITVFSITISS